MKRFLIPETVQSSAMDCGPASLKSLLEGFGIHASYGRLREACQTSVDGTSIDALEETAAALGLEACQIMAPADHLLAPEAGMLPALAVVRLPGGVTHFVVIWRRVGSLLQIMDPAAGRKWVSARRFQQEIYRHTQGIPASAWLDWTQSGSFQKTIRARAANLGFDGRALVEKAARQPGWRPMAAVDAAIRMTDSLVATGALACGAKLEALAAGFAADPENIPDDYWSVREDPEAADRVLFSAAVLIQVKGRAEGPARELPAELRAALVEPPARPGLEMLRHVWRDSRIAPGAALGGLVLAAAGVLFQGILFRGLFDLADDLRFGGQRWWASAALLAVLGVAWLLEAHLAALVAGMGRKLELRVRAAFLHKIPLLGDRYFQSRLVSDMAERGHVLHRLREAPALAAGFLRPVFEMLLTVAAIAWLYPSSAPLAALAAIAAIGIPLAVQPGLAVRDLRLRSHSGALSRFHLDALLGWTPIRTHGAEGLLRCEHASLLGEWARAGLELQRIMALAEGGQLLVTLGVIALLLFRHLGGGGEVGALLLLVYWVLRLPALGQEAAAVAWQYPSRRNIALRVLEPLGAKEELSPRGCDQSRHQENVPLRLDFENVTVRAAGHTILRDVNLSVEPGEHVGIVGPSGAGKSSLLGLLLGWHEPAAGSILVNGEPLEVDALRREIAWVDPQVHLWNRSLIENLRYGAGSSDLEAAVTGANLRGVVARLPDGMASPLGESGALVSGGEGQRVRLARALLKANARLVLLDEPARGLDRSARRSVLEHARETWRKQTLLAVTHDVSDTLQLPRVLVIEEGRIVEDGEPRALAADPQSRYRALLDVEDGVRRSLWSSARWRRLRLDEGRLVEEERKELAWRI
jgi:ATP-binding cassette subfamily B protein